MKVTAQTTTTMDYNPGGENLLAFESLELKACCARQIINDWEDYILVPTDYMPAEPANNVKPVLDLG